MIGLPLMVLLGMGVRGGATPVDAWLQQAHGTPLSSLLVFTDYRTAQALLITSVMVSLYRRLWSLLPVIVLLPLIAVAASSVLKPVFGRMKEQGLAYPSGLIMAVGIRRWLVWAAVAFAGLGILGQSVTYHYFTDALGSVLLGTSLVCLAVAALRWARRRTRGWLRLRL
jgi:formate hydrogenlyase subunit 3/multisubunit Na+/H+ antiporter MnhD subunit